MLNAVVLPMRVREAPEGSDLEEVTSKTASIPPRSQTPVVEVPKEDTENISYFERMYCLQTRNSVSNCPNRSNRKETLSLQLTARIYTGTFCIALSASISLTEYLKTETNIMENCVRIQHWECRLNCVQL